MKKIIVFHSIFILAAMPQLNAATVYENDFSSEPTLVFSAGGNDSIAFGASGAVDQANGP